MINYSGFIASAIAFIMLSETVEAQAPTTPDQVGYFRRDTYKL
jgi:hypothetical protein